MKKQLTSIFVVALLVAISSTGSHGFSGGGGVRPMYNLISGPGIERNMATTGEKAGNGLSGKGGNGFAGGQEGKGFSDHGAGNGLVGGFEKGFAQGSSHAGNGVASGGFER